VHIVFTLCSHMVYNDIYTSTFVLTFYLDFIEWLPNGWI